MKNGLTLPAGAKVGDLDLDPDVMKSMIRLQQGIEAEVSPRRVTDEMARMAEIRAVLARPVMIGPWECHQPSILAAEAIDTIAAAFEGDEAIAAQVLGYRRCRDRDFVDAVRSAKSKAALREIAERAEEWDDIRFELTPEVVLDVTTFGVRVQQELAALAENESAEGKANPSGSEKSAP